MSTPCHDFHCDRCGKDMHCPTGAFGTHRKWCSGDKTTRFWAKVDRRGPDDCWPWTGSRKPMGYGHFVMLKKDYNAHRLSYELANGPIPAGQHVLHRCDNPPCVNPAHLFLGTHTDNMHDMDAKGRKSRGEATRRHKLTAEDVRAIRAGFRQLTPYKSNCGRMAKQYGVTSMTVLNAALGRTWSHLK